MIETTPGAVFTATTTEIFDVNLEGAMGVRIEAEDGTPVVARTTIGIVEVAPGLYRKTNLVAPPAGNYIVVWDDATQFANEALSVVAAPAAPVVSMLSYTTVDEFVDWMALNNRPWTATEEEAERVLLLAERDIDNAVGFRYRSPTNLLKFGDPAVTNEFGMSVEQRTSISRATCAQAEYRLQMGPDFFIEHQREQSSGPDVTETGRVSKIGPMAQRELTGSGLLRLTGRMV